MPNVSMKLKSEFNRTQSYVKHMNGYKQSARVMSFRPVCIRDQ